MDLQVDQARITVSSHGARAMTLCRWISTWINKETAILPESGTKFDEESQKSVILPESGTKFDDRTAMLPESGNKFNERISQIKDST